MSYGYYDTALDALLAEGDRLHDDLLQVAMVMDGNNKRRLLARKERSKTEPRQKKKRIWVRDWIQRRHLHGGGVLLRELETEDPKSFLNALRMNTNTFRELLGLVEQQIQKADTYMRAALSAELKLQITLRYLATGDSFKSLSYFFRVPTSTISTFLPEVLRAISQALSSNIKVRSYKILHIEYVSNMQHLNDLFRFRIQKKNGRTLRVSSARSGTSVAVVELLTENMCTLKHRLAAVLPFIITKVFTALYCLPWSTRTTIFCT